MCVSQIRLYCVVARLPSLPGTVGAVPGGTLNFSWFSQCLLYYMKSFLASVKSAFWMILDNSGLLHVSFSDGKIGRCGFADGKFLNFKICILRKFYQIKVSYFQRYLFLWKKAVFKAFFALFWEIKRHGMSKQRFQKNFWNLKN